MNHPGRDESVGRLLERALRRRVTANSLDDCPGADTLAAWSDGTLTAGERASVEAHAADCARCQAQLAAMARMMAAEPVAPQRSSFHLWPWLVPVTAAAAALVLWVWVQPPPPSGSPESPAQVQTTLAAPAAEPPAYVAEPGGRAATPPGRGATPQARAVTPPPARTATAAARAEGPPPAAAPMEEKRAVDSTLAERQRDQSNVSQRARTAAQAEDARSNRESVMAPAIAASQAAPAALARSTAQRTLDIVSPDPAIRWRVSGSAVQRSTDAGATWQPQSPGVDVPLTAGAAPQPSVCWLVGRGGTVLLSTDGQTWRRLPFPEAVDLAGVRASSAASASVTTADGRVLATSDGGATWAETPRE
jgi:hypothetical protein